MIAERFELSIATDFTVVPGPRHRSEGDYSGEEFLDKLLRPRFVDARDNDAVLHVNLDGAVGYPTSFLEQAFGGLAREFGAEEVERHLEITCTDEPYLLDQIRSYIQNANKLK
jgi:hypothetical protein